MRNQLIRKQKGMILPVVLIFFSVLMLLGVTIVSVSGNQVSGSMSQVNRSQAYYLAKSGAETFAEHIIKEVNRVAKDNSIEAAEKYIDDLKGMGQINGSVTKDNQEQLFDQSTLKFVVSGNNNELIIKSTSMINKSQGEAEVRLTSTKTVLSGGKEIVIDYSNKVILFNDPDSTKEQLYGSKIDHPHKIDKNHSGNIKLEEVGLVPRTEFKFPAIPDINKVDIYLPSLLISSGNSKTIDLEDNGKDTVVILVDDLIVDGNLKFNNLYNKKLIIYVKDKFTLGSQNQNPEINYDGKVDDLIIFYGGNNQLNGKNNSIRLNGTIYAPNAHLEVDNHSHVIGSLIMGSVSVDNQSVINGSVVTDHLTYKTNASIIPSGKVTTIPSEIISEDEVKFEIYFSDNPWN